MAANSNSSNSNYSLYYGISFGSFVTSKKEIDEGRKELILADIKAKALKSEPIDTRGGYYEKDTTGDYKYAHFYDTITGILREVEVQESNNGKKLLFKIEDHEGDICDITVNLYKGKYGVNLLNRLCNVADLREELTLRPYSMPATFTDSSGKVVNYNNAGVSLKMVSTGSKVKPKYSNIETADNYSKDFPIKNPFEDEEGNTRYSIKNQVDFLLNEVKSKLEGGKVKPVVVKAKEEDNDDLPF